MSTPPLILVTNDDGILSPGLLAAAEAVADLGELLVVAPATQQTAMSRAFYGGPDAGVVEPVELQVGALAVTAWAVTGSPAMAVTHAVLELAGRPIDLCISGINYGENIGGGIGVSGTIGAALEAETHGIASMAASVTAHVSEWRTYGSLDWSGPRHFTRLLAARILAGGMPAGVAVLNLNVPREATAETEVRKTIQSRQRYYLRVPPAAPRPLGEPHQFPVATFVDTGQVEPGSDIEAVDRDKVVSITPLSSNMTAITDWVPAL